jgi:diadenosine tetraphosphatase ApaH/serine/threonine PP2A family protein phosphatase
MRIAIVSDIHSNLEALERTLDKIHELEADRVYCLGDVVGYGPHPNECVTLVREQCTATVLGNHDSDVVGTTPLDEFNSYGRKAIEWTAERITRAHRQYLESLPLMLQEGNLTLAHASPKNPKEWQYVISWPQAKDAFKAFKSRLCFIGHTHRPLVIGEDQSIDAFRREGRYLINVGSVGQPRDGIPTASFGFLNTRKWTFEIIRVPYNIDRTANAINKAGLPEYLARRLYLGI